MDKDDDGSPGPEEPPPSWPLVHGVEDQRYRVNLPDIHFRGLFNPDRLAEVAMVVERTPGWMLLQSKCHYPPGVFRLPTGTVVADETPAQAMVRELYEEANLVPGQVDYLLTLEYRVEGGRQDFATVVFRVTNPQGELRPNDPSEAICAWREAPISELENLSGELSGLEGERRGWGIVRGALHRAVACELKKRGQNLP